MNPHNDPRYRALIEALLNDKTEIPMNIEVSQAWIMLLVVQIAWKKSGQLEWMRDNLEHVGRLIQGRICELYPELLPYAERGWRTGFIRPSKHKGTKAHD